MADGKIRIDTRIDNSNAEKDLHDLEKSTKSLADKLKNCFKKITVDDLQTELKKVNASLKENERLVRESQKEIQKYQDKLNNIDGDKGLSSIKKELSQAHKELDVGKKKIEEYQKKLDSITVKKTPIIEEARKNNTIGWNDDEENMAARIEHTLNNDKGYQRILDQEQKITDKMDDYKTSVEAASNKIPVLNEKLEKTKSTLSNDYAQNIRNLSQEIETAQSNTSFLKGKVEDLKTKISKMKDEGTSCASKIKKAFSSAFGKAGSVAGNFFKRIGKSTTNSTKSIKRMGLAILGIRAAYSLVRKAADQYLESNQTASNQISAIWNTLGAMIGPIVDMVISGVVTALSYINALVKALTGIDFVAKANANALKKQTKATKDTAKATKEANAQLADFDEMSKLEDKSKDNSGSGSGTGLFIPTSVDTSWIDGLKDAFNKGAYELGKYLGESLNDALRQIDWDKIKSTAQDIGKNIALFLNGAIDGIDWKLLGSTIGEGLNTVLNFTYGFVSTFNFRGFGEALGTAFDSCFKTIDWNMLAETISKGFIGIFNSISGFLSAVDWQNIGKTILDFMISIDWGGIASSLAESVALILKGLVDMFVGWLTELIAQLPNITSSIFEWISSIDWNSLGKSLGEYVSQIVGQLIDVILNTDWVSVVVNIAGIIGSATLGIIDFVVGFVQAVLDSIWNAITKSFNYNDFLKWIEGVVVAIQDGIANINQWFEEIFQEAHDAICEVFAPIGEWFSDRWDDICDVFAGVGDWFNDTFGNAIEAIKKIFGDIGQWFSDRYDDVCNAFSSIGTWFSEKITGAWNAIKGIFSPDAVTRFFAGVWNNIKGAFGSVSDWFRGTFADAWQSVKNVFSSGGAIFNGIKDGILNGLKAVINALIKGINRVIKIPFDGINSALKTIKSTNILGFKPFSWIGTITVPSIPKLAKGGIVNNPTMFQAGEAGKEAVLPLQNNTQWMQDLADFINSQRDDDGEKEINLYIDGERFFRWFIKKYKQWQLQTNG